VQTHIVNTAEHEAPGEIQRITGFGVDFSVETTGVPALLRQAVDCLAPRGTCGAIGAAAMGTEVSLDTNTIERLMTYYDFDQIDEAARDAGEGKVIKPVLRIGA
jgi:aryl-alcohol dehydrogenase